MSFAGRSTDDFARIVAAGGGIRLSAAGRSTDDLARLAAAARNGGGQVTFIGMEGRSTDELARIAAAGHGRVILEG
jgi:hypothetical protein